MTNKDFVNATNKEPVISNDPDVFGRERRNLINNNQEISKELRIMNGCWNVGRRMIACMLLRRNTGRSPLFRFSIIPL